MPPVKKISVNKIKKDSNSPKKLNVTEKSGLVFPPLRIRRKLKTGLFFCYFLKILKENFKVVIPLV